MKKLLALLLCLCMAIACTGCVSNDPAVQPEATETPAPESTQDVFVESEEPGADGLDDEEQEIVVEELLDVESLMINPDITNTDWMNILLLGGDSRGENEYGRTDAIIILSVNQTTGEAKMTSIMRDTWLKIYGKGEQKINAANVYGGPELVMRTVNEYFGMNISKYVLVNMEALAEIVDALGGVQVPEVTEAQMKALNQQMGYDEIDFGLEGLPRLENSGENVMLTGYQALAYARIRNLDSDYARVDRQRTVLIAIAQQLKNMGATTAVGLIPTLLEHVETNLGMTELLELAGVGLELDMSTVEQLRLPAEGTYKSGKINGLWKIVPNFEKNEKILYEFIYGAEDAE